MPIINKCNSRASGGDQFDTGHSSEGCCEDAHDEQGQSDRPGHSRKEKPPNFNLESKRLKTSSFREYFTDSHGFFLSSHLQQQKSNPVFCQKIKSSLTATPSFVSSCH